MDSRNDQTQALQSHAGKKHGQFRALIFGVAILASLTVALLTPNRPEALAPGVILVQTDDPVLEIRQVFPLEKGTGPLAHYTEHLAWLPNIGVGSRPMGHDTNAFTNHYSVHYVLSGPAEDLNAMLGRMKTVFDPITLPAQTALTERDIVLREYDLWYANNPDARASTEVDAFLFAGNAMEGSVIGTPDQIKALTYDDAKAFHSATHRPEKGTLLVIGDITAARLNQSLGSLPYPDLGTLGQDIVPPSFTLGAAETRMFRFADQTTAPSMIWRKVVALPEPVDFDLLEAQTALLRDILDTKLPGGLAGPLRYDAFITASFDISIWPIDERHIEFVFVATPDKGIRFATLQTTFETALAASADTLPRATYDRVHARFTSFWPDWSDDDDTSNWMADYTIDRVLALRLPKTAAALQDLSTQIDPEDIDRLLDSLVGPGRTAIAFIGKDQSE